MLEDTVGEYSRGLAVVLSVGGVGVGVKTGIDSRDFLGETFFYLFTFYILRSGHEGVCGRESRVEEYRVRVRGLLLIQRKVREPSLVCRPEQGRFHELRLEIYFYRKINGLI